MEELIMIGMIPNPHPKDLSLDEIKKRIEVLNDLIKTFDKWKDSWQDAVELKKILENHINIHQSEYQQRSRRVENEREV